MSLRMSRKKTHRLNYKLCCVQKNNKMVINSDLTSDWMVSVANGRHISANETVSNDDYTKCSQISDCRCEKWHYFVHINIVFFFYWKIGQLIENTQTTLSNCIQLQKYQRFRFHVWCTIDDELSLSFDSYFIATANQ